MPELPEVETVRGGLDRLLTGQRITSLEILHGGSFIFAPGQDLATDPLAILTSHPVSSVRRRAKLLMIDLGPNWSLVIHLKMTGQLVYVANHGERFGAGHPSDSLVDRLPDRSTRLIFGLEQGTLYFNDQRKFGWVRLMPGRAIASLPFVRGLGPEPLDDGFRVEDFVLRLTPSKGQGRMVKAALLDQKVLAGVGNIYADESLWLAAIHPETRVGDIDPAGLERLYAGVRDSMKLSISLGGSTDRNYVDADGRRGAYLEFANVFRRQGQPCKRCGSPIRKTRVAGRGTHWCPVCQQVGGQNADNTST